MKHEILEDLSALAAVEHCTASFVDFENETIYWANKCKCGSDVNEAHECVKLERSDE